MAKVTINSMECGLAVPECGLARAERGLTGCFEDYCIAVSLSREVVHILHRRGGRRLRALQTSSGAMLQLDYTNNVLCAYGPEESLYEVQRQLASLEGPRRPVPTEVWTELMRTRTRTKAANARDGLLAWLQSESGCHIHVERDRSEVRLFGTEAEIAAAEELLDWLAAICCSASVEVPEDSPALDAAALHELARRCDVTLHIGEGCVTALGLRAAVEGALQELQRHFFHDLSPRSLALPAYIPACREEGYPEVPSHVGGA